MGRQINRDEPLLEPSVADSVLRGLATGRYHLLLGAGASVGSHNASGPLPAGRGLEELLREQFGGDDDDIVGLPQVYEEATARLGRGMVQDLLRSRFADAVPAPWHSAIPQFAWEAIWTFNIDDCVEHAYRDAGAPTQRPRVNLWQDRPSPYGGKSDTVPLVHMHGYVGATEQRDDPQLVFSWEEYIEARSWATRTAWHGTFRAGYSLLPIIIVGARLNDELDLVEVLRAGNSSADYGLPSVIVQTDIGTATSERYRRWGLTPVNATAEEFFAYLTESLSARAVESTKVFETRYTQRTFFPLPSQPGSQRDELAQHDFYGGHEPVWDDVLANLDAVPRWLSTFVSGIGPPTENKFQRLYLLQGSPFSGKSTAMLRAGRELQKLGWDPVYLGGRDKLDPEEALAYFADRPTAILLVDTVRFDAYELEDILTMASDRGQRFVCIGTERSRSSRFVEKAIHPRHISGVNERIFIEPTDQFWMEVVERRREHARLGRAERLSDKGVQLYFLRHERQLFSALSGLEDAEGFVDRGLKVFGDLPLEHRLALCAVGLVGSFDLPLHASVASAVSGLKVSTLQDACRPAGSLSDWIRFDSFESGLLKLQHRFIGDLIIRERRQIPAVDMGSLAAEIAIALADRVDVEAISERRLEYRIVASVMDLDNVSQLVPADAISQWYESLREYYGWNARFWEQRSLNESEAPKLAFSYASRAVSIHRDPFTTNTLGTVLMRRALATARSDAHSDWAQYWKEAISSLFESRVLGKGRYEHPYVTFFGGTYRIAEVVSEGKPWSAESATAVREWTEACHRSGLQADSYLAAQMARFSDEWLK